MRREAELLSSIKIGESEGNWWERANCRDATVDPELFYQHEGMRASIIREDLIKEAKQVCAECPVRRECLNDALEVEIPSKMFGIRGGLTASERKDYWQQLPRKTR